MGRKFIGVRRREREQGRKRKRETVIYLLREMTERALSFFLIGIQTWLYFRTSGYLLNLSVS